MTIHHTALNERLSNLERCAEEAPAGTFIKAGDVVVFVHESSNHLLSFARRMGLPAGNDDRLRNLECALLDFILSSAVGAPEGRSLLDEVATAEGFGEAMRGPEAGRVKAGLVSDRDFLREMGRV